MIPVEETCLAYLDQIIPALSSMFARHLATFKETEQSPTYAIDFKASNTKLLEKQTMYDEVTKIVKEQSPGSSVNLTQPDFLIVVHVSYICSITYSDNLEKICRRFELLRSFQSFATITSSESLFCEFKQRVNPVKELRRIRMRKHRKLRECERR